ncbi:MAG: SGNH/GDSL hydrolase family protein [Lentisphaerae bacterium]|nr:SGNH/GDSL hydrolase family protein [Lentisphaerota bacterium]
MRYCRQWFLFVVIGIIAVPGGGVSSESKVDTKPYWLKPMTRVRARYIGRPGYVAQFGDSITFSMAFWSGMSWHDPSPFLPDDGLPKTPKDKPWRHVIRGARDKGGRFANGGGWRSNGLLSAVDPVLRRTAPEVALIMIGTNDIRPGHVPASYRSSVRGIVVKCLEAACIPVLNTIPPMRGSVRAAEEANRIVREIAVEMKVPLVDYHVEILKRRPGTSWDGTLVSPDGVHPSGGKVIDYSEENLKESGYALRTWLNFLMFRQIYFRILENAPMIEPPKSPAMQGLEPTADSDGDIMELLEE